MSAGRPKSPPPPRGAKKQADPPPPPETPRETQEVEALQILDLARAPRRPPPAPGKRRPASKSTVEVEQAQILREIRLPTETHPKVMSPLARPESEPEPEAEPEPSPGPAAPEPPAAKEPAAKPTGVQVLQRTRQSIAGKPFDPREAVLLQLIDGKKDRAKLIKRSRLPADVAHHLLDGLISRGILEERSDA